MSEEDEQSIDKNQQTNVGEVDGNTEESQKERDI